MIRLFFFFLILYSFDFSFNIFVGFPKVCVRLNCHKNIPFFSVRCLSLMAGWVMLWSWSQWRIVKRRRQLTALVSSWLTTALRDSTRAGSWRRSVSKLRFLQSFHLHAKLTFTASLCESQKELFLKTVMYVCVQDTAELFFEDVRLPADALLGQINKGFYYLMNELPQVKEWQHTSDTASFRNISIYIPFTVLWD